MRLIAEHGYEATTLRGIARETGVSPGLLYRYFPSKSAVVLALYDDLSAHLAREAETMPEGNWTTRFGFALGKSLALLGPHRRALRGLTPVLVADPADGLFSQRTAFSRERIQSVFERAVVGAKNAPAGELAAALGRVLYLAHLSVVLWWLLDRSRDQVATRGLVGLIGRLVRFVALALRLPGAGRLVLRFDQLIRQGLFGELNGSTTTEVQP